MNTNWPRVRIGEVLRRVARFEPRNDLLEYSFAGTYSFARGIFVGERKMGSTFALPKIQRIHAGDFVYCKIMAWEGAFGIVPTEADNCVVSGAFVVYEPSRERVDARFLEHFFKVPTHWQSIGRQSTGTNVRRQSLHPEQFERAEIPLPSLSEQRRIVTRIEEIGARIAEAQKLRQDAAKGTDAIIKTALHRLANRFEPIGVLGDVLVARPRNGWSARCDNAETGVPVLSLGAVTGFRYRGSEFKRTSLYAARDGHFWLKRGDLLITRSNTPELVGHAAIYNGSPAPCIYPDLMMRLECARESADTRFLWYWLQAPLVREFIARMAKGTSPTMKKISQDTVMTIPFPSSLSVSEQRRIVAELDALQQRVDSLQGMQTETASELDALMLSVLDKVFRGEL